MKAMRWTIVALLLAAASLALPQSRTPARTTNQRQDIRYDQKLGSQVPPDATFVNETGKRVRLSDYFGRRPILLQLLFYRCGGACFEMRENLARLVHNLKGLTPGDDYDIVTISVHPAETPELAFTAKEEALEVAKKPGAEKGWHFLTGDWENITKVADSVGFVFEYDRKNDRITHPAGLVLLTTSGRVSQYYFDRTDYPQRFVADAISRAAGNQLGIPTKTQFWGCMSIDPVTGQRTINIERVIKIVGVAFGLLVIGSIVNMSIRHRQPKAGVVKGGGRPGNLA